MRDLTIDSDLSFDTMAANFELMSFVNEFMYLNSRKINAKLELNSYYGKVYVSINAEIGYVSPPPMPTTASSTAYCKPSILRRRRRRAARGRKLDEKYQGRSGSVLLMDFGPPTRVCQKTPTLDFQKKQISFPLHYMSIGCISIFRQIQQDLGLPF